MFELRIPEEGKRCYAILVANHEDGTQTAHAVEPQESIVGSISALAEKYPGCKVKVYERTYDIRYFPGKLANNRNL